MNTNCKKCGVGIKAGHGHGVIGDLLCNTCFIWSHAKPAYRPMSDIPNQENYRLLGCLPDGRHVPLIVRRECNGAHYLEDEKNPLYRSTSEFVGWIADTTKR